MSDETENVNHAPTTDDNRPMPVYMVDEVLNWGVAPDGSAAVVIVSNDEQGPVRLQMSAQTLAELILAMQQAKLQASKNAVKNGNDMIAATPINEFRAASLAMSISDTNAKMVLMVIEPGTMYEVVYGFTHPNAAIDAGRALVREGLEAQRSPATPREGGTSLILPRSGRLIRPDA